MEHFFKPCIHKVHLSADIFHVFNSLFLDTQGVFFSKVIFFQLSATETMNLSSVERF